MSSNIFIFSYMGSWPNYSNKFKDSHNLIVAVIWSMHECVHLVIHFVEVPKNIVYMLVVNPLKLLS